MAGQEFSRALCVVLLASLAIQGATAYREHSPSSARSLSSLADSLRNNLRGQNSACLLGSQLSCKVAELDSQVDELELLTAQVESKLDPVQQFFDKAISVKSTVGEIVLLRNVLQVSLTLASNIPYVGVTFSAAKSVISLLKSPLETLNDAVSKTVKTLVSPWNTLMANTFGRLEQIEALLTSTVSSISSAAALLEGQCVKPLLTSLVPAASPVLSTLEPTVSGLKTGLTVIVNSLKSLVQVLSTSAWKIFETAVNAVAKGIGIVGTPLNALSPLTQLLEKPVNVPWLGKLYFKTARGIPKECPSGWDKSGLRCFPPCDDGYKGVEDVCSSVCPSGYKDLGAACENKYVSSRNVKTLKIRWGKVTCKSGYEKSPDKLFCWKKCDDGWKEHGWLPICYQDCPYGMKMDPTKSKCFKKIKTRTSKGVTCGNGKENIAGICYDECSPGDTDAGLSCFSVVTKSFKISKLADELSKIIDKIKKLPIMSTIEKGITTAVNTALKPILSFLNLPSPNSIPLLKGNLLSVNFLPFQQISNQLQAIDPSKAVEGLLSFGDMFSQQFNKLRQAFKIPSGLDSCNDLECLTNSLGLKGVPVTGLKAVHEKFTTFAGAFSKGYGMLAGSLLGCKSNGETKDIPLLDTLASKLGISMDSCNFKLPFCSSFDVDQTKIDGFVSEVKDAVQGIVDTLTSSNGRLLFPVGKNNFQIPLPVINLVKLFNFNFQASRSGLSWKFVNLGKSNQLHGGFTVIKPKIALAPYVGRDSDGTYILLSFVSEITFRYHGAKDTRGTVRAAYLALGERIHKLEDDEKLQHCYGAEVTEDEQKQFGAFHRERKCFLGRQCYSLCNILDIAYNDNRWAWDPPSNTNFFVKYDAIDEANAWDKPENIKIANKMMTFLFKLDSDIAAAATQARTGWTNSKTAQTLWLPVNFLLAFKAKVTVYKPISVPDYFGFGFEQTAYGVGPSVSFDLLSGDLRSVGMALVNPSTAAKKKPLKRTGHAIAPSFTVGTQRNFAKIYV